MARIDAGCGGHIDTSALTCKTGLVSRSMSYEVYIEDIVTKKKTLKDLKIFLLSINITINYTFLIIGQL